MVAQTTVRVSQYRPNTAMAPHAHGDALISLVVAGDYAERFGARERHFARGHIAFCPPGAVHSQMFGREGAQQIIFEPQAAWLDYLSDCRAGLEDAPCANTALFRYLGDRLLQELRREDEFTAIAREGILLEIVAAFGRREAAVRSESKAPAWLKAAREFIHDHAFSPISVAEIAQAAGRHEIHLAREFRRRFGVSIGAYLRRLRTEEAARLLERPQADITDVALSCGFASHSHLCRVFRAHFGVTPSHYRSRHSH